VAERVQYYGPDGKLITESLRDYTRGCVSKQYASMDAFLRRWNRRRAEEGHHRRAGRPGRALGGSAEEVGRPGPSRFDAFDLICHVAFDQPPLTRRSAPRTCKKRNYFAKYQGAGPAGAGGLLEKYADSGVEPIEDLKILQLAPFNQMGTPDRAGQGLRRQGRLCPGGGRSGSTVVRVTTAAGPIRPASWAARASPHVGRPDPAGPSPKNNAPHVPLTTIKSIQDIMRKDVGVDGDAQRIGQLVWMLFLKIFDDRSRSGSCWRTATSRPLPESLPLAQLGGRCRGHHGR
jgi:hypothetical protein